MIKPASDKLRRGVPAVLGASFLLVFSALAFQAAARQGPGAWTVFVSGLDNPRGLEFGPDGFLYVAEGGRGGTTSTEGSCEQVVPPVGPYTGGMSGRISKISPTGQRSSVVENLPSSQTSATIGSEVSGVADVAFLDGTLYALVSGAGCSHGVADMPNGVLRVEPDGSFTQVADLSAFYQANPVKAPNPADFEPDGTPYSMVAEGGALYVVEPNHGSLDKVMPDGSISRVVDISAAEGHVVPDAVAFHDGNFYVGTLTPLPYADGSANVYKISPEGQVEVAAPGMTTVLGVAFDQAGRMYVLETSTGSTPDGPPLVPNSGKILRVSDTGQPETLAEGLMFPTDMTFGPDGALYVSACGFGCAPGEGQVLKVEVGD